MLPTLPSLVEKEAAARASIEARIGRPLSAAEWRLYRERLLAYFSLLLEWEQDSRSREDLR